MQLTARVCLMNIDTALVTWLDLNDNTQRVQADRVKPHRVDEHDGMQLVLAQYNMLLTNFTNHVQQKSVVKAQQTQNSDCVGTHLYSLCNLARRSWNSAIISFSFLERAAVTDDRVLALAVPASEPCAEYRQDVASD